MSLLRHLRILAVGFLAIAISGCSGTSDQNGKQASRSQQHSNSFEGDPDPALVVGAFNIKWLGDGESDRVERSSEHVATLASIFDDLKPEVWGLQEIENEAALQRLLSYCNEVSYQPFVATSGAQRCALLLRSDVRCDSLWEVPELKVGNNRLRNGLAARISYKGRDAVVLSVHFKATSRYDSTASLRARSYAIRARQAQSLCEWIEEVQQGIDADVVVVGDFNDSPKDPSTPTLMALDSCSNLVCVTRDLQACNPKYQFSIDHIYATEPVFAHRVAENTSSVQFSLYEAFSAMERRKLSDHCPVLVRFEGFGQQ